MLGDFLFVCLFMVGCDTFRSMTKWQTKVGACGRGKQLTSCLRREGEEEEGAGVPCPSPEHGFNDTNTFHQISLQGSTNFNLYLAVLWGIQ